MQKRIDEKYMQRALLLALKTRNKLRGNPRVGCVMVKNERIIGEGYYDPSKGKHAEVIAFESAGKRSRGSTVYVTLEPCVSFPGKRTGPCSEKLIASGVGRVVAAMKDPNPAVNGKGLELLRKARISVTTGILENNARRQNLSYEKFIIAHKPFVFIKVASSIDGYISMKGKRYFSSSASLEFAHALRRDVDAILVGIGTVLADDPVLTTRIVKGEDPLRVILDPKLEIPLNARALQDSNALVIVLKGKYSIKKKRAIQNRGAEVLELKGKKDLIDWNALIRLLGKRKISSLMIEGGSRIITSALNAKIVDRLFLIAVPEIFGSGTPLFADDLSHKLKLELLSMKQSGRDVLLELRPSFPRR